MTENPVAELIEHLKVLDEPGLPEEWFQAASGESSTSSVEQVRLGEVLPEKNVAEDVEKKLSWAQVEQEALSCTKCGLCETRNKVVFGVGERSSPPIVFVGEGPGADEDRLGEPFVGKAGKLLTAAITKGLKLRREDVYICNVVKCRPPQNRTPLPNEVERCFPYLERQLRLLNPRVIVTLGQPAQLALVGIKQGITKIRGQWQQWQGIPLMPTYHPAYLLRNPAAKKDFWVDLQEVMKKLEF